jgi:(2Fe-2S) ferredoxin
VTLNVVVCTGPVCGDRRGSGKLIEHLRVRVLARGLEGRVAVREEVCLGHCLRGPNILVAEGDDALAGLEAASGRAVLYNHMTVEDVDRVVERHLVGGMAVRALTNLPPTPMLPIGPPKNRPR